MSGPVVARLREDGVLWALNRVVLGPRGYALAMTPREGPDIGLILFGDGTRPMPQLAADLDVEKWALFEALLARARAGAL